MPRRNIPWVRMVILASVLFWPLLVVGADPATADLTNADPHDVMTSNSLVTILNRKKVVDLAGPWRFQADPHDIGESERWFKLGVRDRLIKVPSTWQVVFEDLREYVGTGWYEREFTLSSAHQGKRIAAVFCAVNYYTTVWVNGKLAGQNEGGYLPFDVDLTNLINFDQPNTLTVKVTDPEYQLENPVGYQQIEMERMSGIWRQAWIETTGPTYVSDIHVVSDIDRSTVDVDVEYSVPPRQVEKNVLLSLRVDGPHGVTQRTQQAIVLPSRDQRGRCRTHTQLFIDNPKLWSPDNPQLYTVTATVLDENTVVDAATRDFGMRKIDIDGIHIRLNNQPLLLMGAIDAGDVPDKNVYLSEYHAPTDEEIKHEVLAAKQMGFNIIRKHLFIDDHRYYDWADRLGLLVYGEPPYYWTITSVAKARWTRQVDGWVRRDRSHPSVVFWALFNAASGLEPMPLPFGGPEYLGETPTHEQQAAMVQAARDMVKGLDPTRPVLDTSGGKPFNTEIVALMRYGYSGPHSYLRAKSHYPGLRADSTARLPGQGDTTQTRRPLICGELGGYVFFPDIEKYKRQWQGQVPWPIARHAGLGWGECRYMGANYDQRFYEWGLDKVYGSFAHFSHQHDWSAFYDLKFEIEQLRKSPEVTGFIFTLFNNTGPFVHGLVDYDLSLRPFANQLAEFLNPDLLIIDWQKLNYWDDEPFQADLLLSHYGRQPIHDAVIHWELRAASDTKKDSLITGDIHGLSMAQVGVGPAGRISFNMPSVSEGTTLRLLVELRQEGIVLSRNYTDLYVYPARWKRAPTNRQLNVTAVKLPTEVKYSIGDTTGPVKLTKIPVKVGDRINFIADPLQHGGGDTQTLHAKIGVHGKAGQMWDVADDWTIDPGKNNEDSTWSKRWTEKLSDVTQRSGQYPLMTRHSFYDGVWNIGNVPPQFWCVATDVGPFTWKNDTDGDVGIAGVGGVRVPPETVVWNPVNIGSKLYMAVHSWLSPLDGFVDIEFQSTLLQASSDGVRFFIEKNNSDSTLADVILQEKISHQPLDIDGYEQHLGLDPEIPVALATRWDAKLETFLDHGGTVLFLLSSNSQIPAKLGLTVGGVGYALAAKDHFWSFIHPEQELFQRIPHSNPLGWNFCNVLLSHQAIAGIDVRHRDDILVGAYAEWLRTVIRSPERSIHGSVTGMVVQFRFKKGRVVMTTLDLLAHLTTDPVATLMLQDLVEYCHTGFQPSLRLPK
ncbi:MAG: hypothetical protein MK165_13620 [Pirellulaceae bacterium]|nr:hypothetical protein [Pirellulaceae bacterium]